jgi:TRAP transporter TAXI family solute receptor
MPGVQIELLDSTAGVTNLAMLQRNEVDAVSTYADIAYLASVGQLEDMDGAFDDVRGIAALPVRELQVVLAPQSPIQSIRDLRGRRVSLGPPGTGVAITAGLLLSAFGIGSHDIRAEHLAFDEAVLPVMNGEIDAAFWGGRFPNPNIAAATRHGARLLQVVGPEIEHFRAEYPFLRATVIPAGTYPGIEHVVHTVGVDGIFVCRAELDERLVYNLTKAFFQAVSTAGRDVRMLRGFNTSRAAATPLPLHPGAARYYREMEMRR